MTFQAAKAVRDEVRGFGMHCIVPLGFGPDGYFVRIFSDSGPIDFHNRAAARQYQAARLRAIRHADRLLYTMAKHRTPLERLIDAACGR